VEQPTGFPYQPIWHYNDFKVTESKEEKWGLFGKKVATIREYPALDAYGSGELRESNFMKSLQLMQDYRSISSRLAPGLELDQVIQYLGSHGVKFYGVVLTGPTKELIKLKLDPSVTSIKVGEVAF
jgi:hypothetical protein